MAKLPTILRHMTLAIYRSGDVGRRGREAFQSAYNVALSQLVKYGFLTASSISGKPENIRLTAKGHARERQHRREGSAGPTKNATFDMLYATFQPQHVEPEQKKPAATAKAATPKTKAKDEF